MSAERRLRPRHVAGALVGAVLVGYGALRLAWIALPLVVGSACLAAVAWDATRRRP